MHSQHVRAICALLLGCVTSWQFAEQLDAAEWLIHVAPNGRDSARGTANDPTSLAGMQSRLRKLRAVHPEDAVRIVLAGGDYVLLKPLHLDANDSGTSAAPVMIEAAADADVRISGHQPINDWQPIREAAILRRLSPLAATQVRVASVEKLNGAEFGSWCARGHKHDLHPAPLEVFYRDQPAQLARWPNTGWATTKRVSTVGNRSQFSHDQPAPRAWQSNVDVWAHGYWEADWSDAWQPIVGFDRALNTLLLERSQEVEQVRAGARFCVRNVLEELDQPGEWYLDRVTSKLYFWPPAELTETDVTTSQLDHLVTCYDACHLTFRGLQFNTARVCLAEIARGEHVRFENCTFKHAGNLAVHIAGGSNHVVERCQIRSTGEGAIRVEGGDRRSLTPANHVIVGNHIHDFARTCHAGRPAVAVHGVGIRVAGNCIHDGPDAAIILQGNEHLVEGNEIHSVCLETADSGAIYLGHDWTERGNVIQHNCLHHLGRFNRRDVMGVYLDDFASGTTVAGNVFWDAGRAVVIGGGRDNLVHHNVILGGFAGVQADARGLTWAKAQLTGTDAPLLRRLNDMLLDNPTFSQRYPALAQLPRSEPARPAGNYVANNLLWCPIAIDLHDRWTRQDFAVVNNWHSTWLPMHQLKFASGKK